MGAYFGIKGLFSSRNFTPNLPILKMILASVEITRNIFFPVGVFLDERFCGKKWSLIWSLASAVGGTMADLFSVAPPVPVMLRGPVLSNCLRNKGATSPSS